MQALEEVIAQAPVFAGLSPPQLELIARAAHDEHVDPDTLVLSQGGPADVFFVLRAGLISLEVHTPGHTPLRIETLHPGDALGWSWLFAPYRWQIDARAVQACSLVAFDGAQLRRECETDHDLGYELMKRFAEILVGRLQATRLQLLDVYGRADSPS
jgi:CRP/FNR family cyclic AMP-dependent transcriptional regulator